MIEANNDEVICPNCVTQFRAVPVNVQQGLIELRAKLAELEADIAKVVSLLSTMFDKYEEGIPCYEDPEDFSGYLGHAFELNEKDFSDIVELLNRLAPRGTPS